jgi:hypothetical protein
MFVNCSRLHQNIQDALHAEGLEVTFPYFRVIRDGNRTIVSEEFLPEVDQTPASPISAQERLFGVKRTTNEAVVRKNSVNPVDNREERLVFCPQTNRKEQEWTCHL